MIALYFYFYFLMPKQEERNAVTSDANIHAWVEAYKMKSRLAFAPAALEETKTEAVSHISHRFISPHLVPTLGISFPPNIVPRCSLLPIRLFLDQNLGRPAHRPRQPIFQLTASTTHPNATYSPPITASGANHQPSPG